MGKSALLEYVAARAIGCRVSRAGGVQSEMELAFAGVQQLCAPMLDRLQRLPSPQREALSVAFGLSGGVVPDRFLVGLAVLGLLSEVAEERPLVCLVDDVQWLDRASVQVLEFVARRLVAESVGMVFAVRESPEERLLASLPELVLEGLGISEARALLGSAIGWSLDEEVRDRIVAEARGNPLALLELPGGLTPAELASGFAPPVAMPLAERIEESFRRRLVKLPTETRRLLLVAAAEPVGDPLRVWGAAELLGIGVEAADAAGTAGLCEFGARVRFSHPLARSAAYRLASPVEQREAHRMLAEVTDPRVDPDRRVWHLAQATSGHDEVVASELEHSAARAQGRGGLAAAAAFLERSFALTPDPAPRAERALAAARAKAQAGAFDAALGLLAAAEAAPLAEFQQANAELLRGQVAFASSRDGDASPQLLKAAKRLERFDVALARETYLEALSAAMHANRLVIGGGLRKAAEAARAAPPASAQPPSASDLLLDGLALLITENHAAAAPTLKRAVRAFGSETVSIEEATRWLWLASVVAVSLWDDESWDLLSERQIKLARDAGALGMLPNSLNHRASVHLHKGEFAAAVSVIEEAAAISDAMGNEFPPYAFAALAAYRGRERQDSETIETNTKDLVAQGQGVRPTFVGWASAVLYNGLGRYEEALKAAQQAREDELVLSVWAAVELIEAATRSGVPEQAITALERVLASTRASGTDWALGVEACARALLSEDETAERLYRQALERLGRTRARWAIARAHLVYGEWLRRKRRRTDARQQLQIANELFVTMGAHGFAQRAERELLATGETARKRVIETSGQLTSQEAQVARLARDGLSNAEIGARLFISARTVQYHLRNVFTKLGISSRAQLDTTLPSDMGVSR
jgi:DNA-binding CsgD family transcriptional regulator